MHTLTHMCAYRAFVRIYLCDFCMLNWVIKVKHISFTTQAKRSKYINTRWWWWWWKKITNKHDDLTWTGIVCDKNINIHKKKVSRHRAPLSALWRRQTLSTHSHAAYMASLCSLKYCLFEYTTYTCVWCCCFRWRVVVPCVEKKKNTLTRAHLHVPWYALWPRRRRRRSTQ